MVGTKSANGLELYDMTGNVWEWVEDIHDSSAYSKHRRQNPVITGGESDRVNRDGGWCNLPWNVRCASRGDDVPGYRSGNLGFRLARND